MPDADWWDKVRQARDERLRGKPCPDCGAEEEEVQLGEDDHAWVYRHLPSCRRVATPEPLPEEQLHAILAQAPRRVTLDADMARRLVGEVLRSRSGWVNAAAVEILKVWEANPKPPVNALAAIIDMIERHRDGLE